MEQHIYFCTAHDGTSIAYAISGQGPPLVKVANWLSHLEFDWQSPVWRHWLTGLSLHHRLVRYDERGCGLSDWEVGDFSPNVWVQDLEAVIDAVDIDRFPLIGISQGGPVAIDFTAAHPEKVSHLILYGTYVRGRMKRNPSPKTLREIEMFNEMTRLGWGKSNPAFRQVFSTLFMPDASAEQLHWLNDLQRISATPENAVKIRESFSQMDVSEKAAQLAVPTLILHPKEDALVPFEEGRILAKLITGSRFVPLDSRNHILLEDEPAWKQFLYEIYDFLEIPMSTERMVIPEQVAQHPAIAELTSREKEVLELIAQGFRNQEIARKLVLSPKTVRNYISIIFSKLEVSSRGEAIVKARQAGFGRKLD